MRILVLSALAPYPPHDGDKLRLFHHLESLRRRGHTLDLFCLTRSRDDLRTVRALKPWLHRLETFHLPDRELVLNVAGSVFHERSWNVAAYFSPRFRAALDAYAATDEGFTVQAVLAYRLRMAPYADGFVKTRAALRPDLPRVPWALDLVDCLAGYMKQAAERRDFPWTRRLAAGWDEGFLSLEEPSWASRADAAMVVSEVERQHLARLGASVDRLWTVPNGIDPPSRGKTARPSDLPPGRPVVSFVGNLGYAPNEEAAQWFLDHVWPRVRGRCPEAFFCAVGGNPSRELLKRQDGRNVLIRGYVPEIEPYVTHAALTVAPLQVASGFQNKVALSLAHGVPVVATSKAIQWMPEDIRKSLRAYDGPEAFAEGVLRALAQAAPQRALARRVGKALLRRFSWESSGREAENCLRRLRA